MLPSCKVPHPSFEGTLRRRQTREFQSQGIRPLDENENNEEFCGPLASSSRYQAWILRLFVSLDEMRFSRVEHSRSTEIEMCTKWRLEKDLSALRNKQGANTFDTFCIGHPSWAIPNVVPYCHTLINDDVPLDKTIKSQTQQCSLFHFVLLQLHLGNISFCN